MVDFCLCKYNKCQKSSICKRILTKESGLSNPVYMRFENLCSEKSGWKWLMEVKQEIVAKKEGDDNSKKESIDD